MKWAFSIRRKISAALLLTAIFVLLFVKSMMDNRTVNELADSFSSVYEDRLVVEGYIYRMSDHLFRKKIMVDTAAHAEAVLPEIERYNRAILDIIEDYEKTKLTRAEDVFFENYKANVGDLMQQEKAYLLALREGSDWAGLKASIDAGFRAATMNLDSLSRIQLSEGRLLKDNSQKIVAGSSILAHFEVGILIAIGLMVLVLVFESTASFLRKPQNPN